MKNLTTKNTKNGATKYFTKSFDASTPKGNKVTITVQRRVVDVTADSFKSGYEYGLSFNGKQIIDSQGRKDILDHHLNFVDEWAHRPDLF